MSEEMLVLQAIRLKGRPDERQLATATGIHTGPLRQTLRSLADAALCVEVRGHHQLTSIGRDRLTHRLAEERGRVNQTSLAEFYEQFLEHNAAVKRIVTDWQLIDSTTANNHDDAAYDVRIIGRLAELHDASRAVLAGIVGLAPRLAHYPGRLANALAKVQAGERTWLAGPLIDSYHTVWFELHEDLLGLTGRVRADEAALGRVE